MEECTLVLLIKTLHLVLTVNKVQINIAQTEILELLVKSGADILLSMESVPELGDN